jgi:SAM-dependent methyltransferase
MKGVTHNTPMVRDELTRAYIDFSSTQPESYLQQWIDACFVDIPPHAAILELGSGSSRAASYLESVLGYTNVVRSDASPVLVERLRTSGYGTAQLDVLRDRIPERSFGVIFADAVLPHFDDDELTLVLKNIFAGLRNGGEFYFTAARVGTGQVAAERPHGEQPCNRLSEAALLEQLELAGFQREDTVMLVDPTEKWLHVATRKMTR